MITRTRTAARTFGLTGLIAGGILLGGCSSTPQLTKTGFLSSYSSLQKEDDHKLRYVSSELRAYKSFIVDPVKIESHDDELTPTQRATIAEYCREAFVMMIHDRGYQIVSSPRADTARLRIAITSVQDATWWKKIHPASSLAGAGRGGAAMEAEIVDANTGAQLAAVIQAGVGSQFKAFNISTVSDIKNTIDVWAEDTGDRIDDLRAGR